MKTILSNYRWSAAWLATLAALAVIEAVRPHG